MWKQRTRHRNERLDNVKTQRLHIAIVTTATGDGGDIEIANTLATVLSSQDVHPIGSGNVKNGQTQCCQYDIDQWPDNGQQLKKNKEQDKRPIMGRPPH